MSVPDVSGTAIANLEVESLIHRAPTFHGDTIYAETKVIGKVESKSRDDRGVVTVETKGFNQRGEEVCFFRRKVMVWKQAAAPAAPAPLRGRRLGLSPTGRRRAEPADPPDAPRHDPRPGPGHGRAIERGGSAAGADSRRPDLPWRSTRDPWAVLVSEVMAQQTQLARVVPAYRRFLAGSPRPPPAPAAPLGDVLRAWQGLGLQPAGRQPAPGGAGRGGRPRGSGARRPRRLLALPGVGAYTARAVLAFAFEADVGVVDTNAGRVLSRAVAGRPLRPGEAQRPGRRHGARPGGAGRSGRPCSTSGPTVCVAGAPRCRRLPDPPTVPVGARPAGAAPIRRVGSAGVSTAQSRFDGSDRQGRGRLVDALRHGRVPARRRGRRPPGGPTTPAGPPGWPPGWSTEGLVVADRSGGLRLP